MKVNVSLRIPAKRLPADYRPVFLSLFKAVLSRSYPEDCARLYGGSESKDFTFAVKFTEPVFSEESVTLSNENALLTLSFGDEYLAMLFYNAFRKNVGYNQPLEGGGTMAVDAVRIIPQPTLCRGATVIRFLSPLAVRRHAPGEADRYYVYSDPEFADCLNRVVSRQLGREVRVLLEPLAPRKTVTRAFGVKIRCSLGSYRLTAEPEVLDALAKSGIGSRRNMGFGFFAVTGG